MRRSTSDQAYAQIMADGTIADSQKKVWSVLYLHPDGLTGREVNTRVGFDGHKRLSELERRGLIQVIGERLCSHSNKTAVVWQATDRIIPLPKRSRQASQRELKEKRLRELLQKYTESYPESCRCAEIGRDWCLLHQSLDALSN